MLASDRWRLMLGPAALAMLVLCAGCATRGSEEARMRALQPQLVARGDPDSLATAGYIERWATQGQWRDAPELTARAAAAAPTRADLALMQLQVCYQVPACGPEPLEARLRQLDPTNGISWIYALARASRSNDQQGVMTALAGLAQAQRIDEYWTRLVSLMTAQIAGHAGFDASAAFVAVVGTGAAMAAPPLQPISTYCTQQAVRQEDVLKRCRRIIAAFEHADTLLLASFGNHMAARVWPEGSAERVRIDAERSKLDYWMGLWTQESNRLNSPQAIRTLTALYPRYATELAVIPAWYGDLGLSPEPPPERHNR